MAGPRTAKDGKADWSLIGPDGPWTEIPEVRKISLKPANEAKTYASSSTGGNKRRLGGIDDHDGSVEVYIDPETRFDAADALGIRAGVNGWFRFYEARTDEPFVVPAYINDVDYGIEIEDGNIEGATIAFSGDGGIKYPGD